MQLISFCVVRSNLVSCAGMTGKNCRELFLSPKPNTAIKVGSRVLLCVSRRRGSLANFYFRLDASKVSGQSNTGEVLVSFCCEISDLIECFQFIFMPDCHRL